LGGGLAEVAGVAAGFLFGEAMTDKIFLAGGEGGTPKLHRSIESVA
jgi:hypothetical protein